MPKLQHIKGYKGFSKDWTCNGMQYALGKTATHSGSSIKLCNSGLHFCEYPLDVFNYYDPANSVFAVVDATHVSDDTSDDTKRVAKKLKLEAKIGIPGMVKAAVEYIIERVDETKAENTPKSHATNTGDSSAATNTGDRSAATNTGDRSAATNTGYSSAATNTGYSSAATNTGYSSAATNTGYSSAATNTGDRSAATNTGYSSAAQVDGKESIAIVTGYNSKAAGKKGCWIVLTERYNWQDDYKIKEVKAFRVDGKTVKVDTFYTLRDGEAVEV